jgi:DNA-binding NtrC family response regulator
MAKLLLVDDDSDFTSATRLLLQAEGHTVYVAASLEEARKSLAKEQPDLLFVDLALPDGSGLELIDDNGPKTVIITGHPSVESAVRAVRGPVIDYLVKPLDKAQLMASIGEAEPRSKAKRKRPTNPTRTANIIGESEPIKALLRNIAEFGPTDATVLITGESGTGKDLVARALHDVRSSDEKFVAVNCGAIPKELIGSELFGHEKGSFTGAAAKRVGIFERAKNGTVFLDEVGELPPDQQVALLRVLESNVINRVGGEADVPVSARVIAATNKNLEKAVGDGSFREDLFFRLMVLPVHVPPLRERPGDIELLANYFLEQYAGEHGAPLTFAPEVMQKLNLYHWPGNVRELKHAVLRAAILNRGRDSIDEVPADFDRPLSWSNDSDSLRPGMSIRDVERKLIEKTLQHFDQNKKLTAEALGISLKTLYNRLSEYEESSDKSPSE